ncbi:hypothetical protein ACS0TY_018277 [Phlomoides rotata]
MRNYCCVLVRICMRWFAKSLCCVLVAEDSMVHKSEIGMLFSMDTPSPLPSQYALGNIGNRKENPFHEVKSKREKKKEGKDNPDARARGTNNSSTRRSKSGTDRQLGRGASAPFNASESLYGKSAYKKENGSAPYTSHFSSGPGLSGNNRSKGPSAISDVAPNAESKGSFPGTADGTSSFVQPVSEYQSAWVGVPGQVSMADIVRMGRPHNKASNAPNASHHHVQDPSTTELLNNHAQQVPVTDEWPSIEKPAPSNAISVPDYAVDSELYPEASGLPPDSNNHHYEAEEILEREEDNIESSEGNDLGSVSSRKILENHSSGALLFENELYKNMGSFHSEAPDFEHHEDEEVGAPVSSVTRDLQQLSVEDDDREFPSEGTAPSVVIPNHLQVQNADCSHLSFGSFGAAISAPYSSGTMATAPVKTNLEEGHSEAANSSAAHVDTRNSEYYIDDSVRNSPDSSLFHRNGPNGVSVGSYDASSAPQPEELKPESTEVAHGNQYPFPSSNPGYTLDDAQRLNAAFSETSSQMQNLAPFSNVMQQSYTSSLPNTLLAGNGHSIRESDLQYSQFPVAHAISTKYVNSASPVSVSAISMSEALKTAALSSTQPGPQSFPGTSMGTGPPLPQHIAVHPYSQPALPLGPFGNLMGYPFMPQNYTYVPSAFQQSFAGSSAYHQSLAAVLPQYKSSVSVSSLPQSAAVPSGYGAFGNATTVPGNYPMNPPAAPSGSTLNYEDVLSSQYKENSQLLSLQAQQNENAAMWLHGHSSRTAQAVPSSAYYNYQGQSQQPGGFRQGQQQSQNYGAPGYANFYHSQTGISLDHQQQNPRDGPLVGAQGQPKQSQMWPNGY